MNKPTHQSAGMVSAEAHGTGAPIPTHVGAVRPQICTECLGEGLVYGYYTNDPGEKLKSTGCPRCNGTGEEPQDGCGPWCGCWLDAQEVTSCPFPGYGYCSKDEAETRPAMRIGELARWREEELDNEDL